MLVVLMSIVSNVASAHDFEVDGIYYNITSSSAPLTVAVTYQGSGSYDSDEYSGSVTIPETVTYDGRTYSVTSIEDAFAFCSGLTSITIPKSVTSIANGACAYSQSLTSIVVDNGNTKYDSRNGCNAIIETETNTLIAGCNKSVIPENVTKIGDHAFYGCYDLIVTIPNSVTSIEGMAFYGCRALTSVTIPENVTEIGGAAFFGCFGAAFFGCLNLASIMIPNSVTSIGSDAFVECALTSITIPSSVTSIGTSAFRGCSKLTSIVVEDGNTKYDSRNGCNAIIETATNTIIAGCINTVIPESVTSIGEAAFWGCRDLTSVSISNSVTSIGLMAFSHCSSLTSIVVENGNPKYDSRNGCNAIIETATNTLIAGCSSTVIPESVTSIGINAFTGTSLTSITIPNGVTEIGIGAFLQCESLTSVTIPNSVTSIGNAAFSMTPWHDNQPDGLVYAGKVAYRYKGTMPQNTNIILEEGTLGIAASAFDGCTGLTSITIPSSVTSIGSCAFSGCLGLTSITIPNSVNSIGQQAFYCCSGLSSVTIPNSVISVGNSAFSGCTGLTSVTIPSSVTSIGDFAFECENLISVRVKIPTPLSIGEWTFWNRFNATLYVPVGSKAAYEAAQYWQDFKEIIEIPTVNVGSTGFATFCSPVDMDFSSVTDIKAYIASGFNPSTGTLVLTRVTEVPAGEGLYIVGDEGSYNVPATTTDMVYSNLLKGVTTATTISPTDGDNTNFILANGSHGVGFYTLSAAGELAAGKAYLQLPTASVASVKAINVVFNDEETAIKDVEQSPNVQGIYNLQGQQVNAPRRGLYIINGKKVIIK